MDYDDSQDPILAIHGYPNVPTYPASHGCVRIETWDQDALFSAASRRDVRVHLLAGETKETPSATGSSPA